MLYKQIILWRWLPLALLWLGGAPDPAVAATVHGKVLRDPNPPPQHVVIPRYRGRESAQSTDRSSDCACEPWRYPVVYLIGDSLPPLQIPTTSPRMAQKGVLFEPSVLAVAVGTTVEFPNLDPFFHNVFSFSRPKKFDLGRYPTGESEAVTFDKPGLVKVFCEIHASMRAYIHVLETPYFTVAAQDGAFVIHNVAPGAYTLHCWQENLPDLTLPITVTGDSLAVEVR